MAGMDLLKLPRLSLCVSAGVLKSIFYTTVLSGLFKTCSRADIEDLFCLSYSLWSPSNWAGLLKRDSTSHSLSLKVGNAGVQAPSLIVSVLTVAVVYECSA